MTGIPLLVPGSFRIIAHRGASAYAPENTMAAFDLAERMGVREVELDVQLSKDGHLVVCHDRTLDRYGFPGRSVAESSLEELQALDMGSWFSPFLYGGERLITLRQLISRFGDRLIYHVEIKDSSTGIESAILDVVNRFGDRNRVVVTSFDDSMLERIRALASNLALGWLVREGGLSAANVRRARALGCLQICPRAGDVDQASTQAAQRELAEVRVYGVKKRGDAAWAIKCGVDGMTIDWPDWLKHRPKA